MFRQCSIGYHNECSDDGYECDCSCHTIIERLINTLRGMHIQVHLTYEESCPVCKLIKEADELF